MKKEKYIVGHSIKDGDGNEWVIAQKWVHEKWTDLALLHKSSGERSSLRVRN